MNLMAGDLSKSLGWAFVRDWGTPQWGTHELPRGGHVPDARVFHEFRTWLYDRFAWFKPDVFAVEAPMVGGSVKTAAGLLIGLEAHAAEICHDLGIRYERVAVNTVRLHFCGSGHADKDDVGMKCRSLGWQVADHNAADALALLSYTRDCILDPAPQQLLGGVRG